MISEEIPKVIHYCWLGKGKKSPFVKGCINSWKKIMPDYTIKCWNENNFDINSVPWVEEAIMQKKWSLASDYIRLYALYTEGGIYMDTDVKVFKRFDDYLKYDFFSSVEIHPIGTPWKGQIDDYGKPLREGEIINCMGILAALIGAKKGNALIKECMDFFGSRHFIKKDGSLFVDIINPGIMAMIAVKYGFVYKDIDQDLENNMKIFSSSVFAGDPATRTSDSCSMHYCDGSWRDKSSRQKLKDYIKNMFPNYFNRY